MTILTYEMTMQNAHARIKVRRKLHELNAGHIDTLSGYRLQAEMTAEQAKAVQDAFGGDGTLVDFHPVVNVIAMADGTGPMAKPPTLAELGVVAPDRSKLH